MRFHFYRVSALLKRLAKLRTENRRLRAELRDAKTVGELAEAYHEELQLAKARISGLEKALTRPGGIDHLTGLLSHDAFGKRYEELCRQRAGSGPRRSDCLVVYHLHGFRHRAAGPRAAYEFNNISVVRFVAILAHVFDLEDALICRQSSNRFLIILPETTRETAVSLAEQVKHAMSALGNRMRRKVDFHACCALSAFRLGEDDFVNVFSETQRLLDQSSRDGGNRIMQAVA